MTTTETVTPKQIQQLRDEASAAGDSEQVALCDLAIEHLNPHGHIWADGRGSKALVKCVEAINAAEAMQ